MRRTITRLGIMLGTVLMLAAPYAVKANEPVKMPAEYIGNKGEYNPDGSKVIPLSPPLSKEQSSILAQKEELAAEYQQVRAGLMDAKAYETKVQSFLESIGEGDIQRSQVADSETSGEPGMQANYVYRALSLTQVAQTKSYYCGPATAYSMLAALGHYRSRDGESLSQTMLATRKYLETEYWGNTPWYGNNWPMPESLNYWRTGSYSGFYAPVGTSVNATTYKSNFTWTIDQGLPVAGNVWEVAYSGHLVGHPQHLEIFHWVPVYGYDSRGDVTLYADPASGASSLGWTSVPRYSRYNTVYFAQLLDGRGYVW